MIIISIPVILIVFFILAGIGIGKEILSINIMPILSFLCLNFIIIGIVFIYKGNKEKNSIDSRKVRKIGFAITIVSAILLILTLCSSLTLGDVFSWIWHNI